MENGEKLVFRGYILPLCVRLSLPQSNQELFLPNGGQKLADLALHVTNGNVTCVLDINYAPPEMNNLEGWRNSIITRIEAIIDSVGFVDGGWHAVEIEDVFVTSSGLLHAFQNSLKSLKQDYSPNDFQKKCTLTMALTRGENGPYFQRALAELGKSIRFQFDSPVHAYRAIEFISQIYANQNNLKTQKDKPKVWAHMSSDLELDDDFIKKTIKIHSDPIRHGEIRNFTEDERTMLFDAAWTVVRKYVDKHADVAMQVNGSPIKL